MEAISGRKTIQEIDADHGVRPIQASHWGKQLRDGASDGRQVLHFKPVRYSRYSQALELTAGELIPGQVPLLRCRKEITREEAIQLWRQKRKQGWQPCEPQWTPPPVLKPPVHAHRQHGSNKMATVLLNPFCPLSTAKVLALKANTFAVLLLLTLLIKARVQIVAASALGIFLLLVQTLMFLAISSGLALAAGGAALYNTQKRRPVGS